MLIELRFTKASPTFILNDDPSSPETILVYTLTSKLLMVGFVTPGRDFSGPSKLDIVVIRVLALSSFIIKEEEELIEIQVVRLSSQMMYQMILSPRRRAR